MNRSKSKTFMRTRADQPLRKDAGVNKVTITLIHDDPTIPTK
jgi:hypothetical protein